jgi:hypothetical protein
VLNVACVAADVGIESSTAEHYVRLLEARVRDLEASGLGDDAAGPFLGEAEGPLRRLRQVLKQVSRSLRSSAMRSATGSWGASCCTLGRHGYTQDDRLHALPADRLWLAG